MARAAVMHVSSSRSEAPSIQMVPVRRIRPEEGLSRKRARDGHADLRASIAQFGVLTPITVRKAPDGSGDYLLVKGQGRTLAARMLGLPDIPALVVDEDFTHVDKVQQFLVENVARLKMRPVDKALLLARAREQGEETADLARRFGVSATTVRRLQAAVEDASPADIAAVRAGEVSLALRGVVARRVAPQERSDVLRVFCDTGISANDAERLLTALSWRRLEEAGEPRGDRLALLAWVCTRFVSTRGSFVRRLAEVAGQLPATLDGLIRHNVQPARAAR